MSKNPVASEDITSELQSKNSTESPEIEYGSWLQELQSGSERAQTLEEEENQGIIQMRREWSRVILLLIIAIVLFDFILVTCYGLGVWNFHDTRVVVVVIVDNFLKIVGLGFLIATEIFKKIYRP